MRHDLLSDALSTVTNAINSGKNECVVKPTSKLIIQVFDLFKREGFVQDYILEQNKKGGQLIVKLNGTINRCSVIKPRFSTKKNEVEKFEKRYLPSKDFGFLIIATPQGLLTHIEVKEKEMGGKLIAYVY